MKIYADGGGIYQTLRKIRQVSKFTSQQLITITWSRRWQAREVITLQIWQPKMNK